LPRSPPAPQKYNQIRNFTKRGVEALVVPWDYDFTQETYDGLFIRCGPLRSVGAGGERGQTPDDGRPMDDGAWRRYRSVSNGPGDPCNCGPTIANIAKALKGDKPIFGYGARLPPCRMERNGALIAALRTCGWVGAAADCSICLGHQLMALAAGAQTKKMLFGNRGQNLPCVDQQTGRCYITSQVRAVAALRWRAAAGGD